MLRSPPISTLFPYTTALPIYHSRLERFLLLSLLVVIAYTLAAYLVLPAFWTHYEHQKGLATLPMVTRSEEHTSELQSHSDLVCRLLLEKKKKKQHKCNKSKKQ